ncbi:MULTISPECIES: M23 family metallopeptidase [Auritidibacter]|uniref:Peptidoglycan DD-metalloendopeptidase family protein n=1 Tax=Auritidibacter ignavus TaxID=678932 RepID=A0AAJ6DCK4_9MICC|nr:MULTISPECIES: M23 family metallopeptidase [Auritidibacter]WGH82152.1 peptidoglycan DD-metalloendopeptidase family protein [Auritidibacter ignavus]WGH84412.1 peptidoglycan DD-metalloendopeptidase family protein [Auritidibacter ignavus]WGH93735.1 peptidoglycan DD-metalloendopeptidase family protein [Auritidibacter ignavus]WHS27906.1 peptidoglycan DD-metalloendopeptidase family protein [Auritidibacter ignavus]
MRRTISGLRPVWRIVILAGLLLIVADLTGIFSPPAGLAWVLGVVGLILVGYLLYRTAPVSEPREPAALRSPVRGRWLAVNSPGQGVPSHGTVTRGQRFAVDVSHPTVAEDLTTQINPGSVRSALRGSPPEEFTCFGEPVCAMAAGTVVEAADQQRDQRARNTWQALLWMLVVESTVRELIGGYRAVLGNRVVIQHDDGTYAAYAHLRRGSVRVEVGQRVEAGEVIAEVGNTGNTTEPHLHVQLMDRASVDPAAGVPMVFRDAVLDAIDPAWEKQASEPSETALEGMPRNGQIFTVPGEVAGTSEAQQTTTPGL